ncbi:MAG: hypothetical protein ACOC9W_02280 [Persicimonas sp.]
MTPSDYVRWRRRLGELMAELRRLAKKLVARGDKSELVALLEAARGATPDAVSAGLVEHLWEFAAFHMPGPSGRTLAECALRAAVHLPAEQRAWLGELVGSFWEIFEVVGEADGGGVRLRRLCDDGVVELAAVERAQPFIRGSAVAVRLFDAGGFWAAPVALMLEPAGLSGLVSRLELEFGAGSFGTRAGFMRARGSALILGHLIACYKRRVLEGRTMVEPQVSLVESQVGAADWRRLDDAFSLVEQAAGALGRSTEPLVLELPGERVFCLEKDCGSLAATLFDSPDAHAAWEQIRCGQPSPTQAAHAAFMRIWRARDDELFPEDVELLEAAGLDPCRDGAAVAIRLGEDGLWHDVSGASIDEIVEVCRLAALRLRAREELAA